MSPEHQDMNGKVEVTWRTLRTVAHYFMVHARVPEVYVHFELMYTTDHIFLVLPIKYLIKRMMIQQRHTNWQEVDIPYLGYVHPPSKFSSPPTSKMHASDETK